MAERRDVRAPEKVDIQMTPMIDIVFQLMAFFLMTFKVATVEGDFALRLPKQHDSPGNIAVTVEPIEVRLLATPDGDLADLRIDAISSPPSRSPAASYRWLREWVERKTSHARAAGQEDPEITFDADDTLRYEHIIAAIEAVQPPTPNPADAGRQHRKIRFANRRG